MLARTFYAVIHAHDVTHGYEQAARALEAGADGIALIDQLCTPDDVSALAVRLKPLIADRGRLLVNILNDDQQALDIASERDCGVWADALTGTLQGCLDQGLAAEMTVLCGFGFKYQRETDLETGYLLGLAGQYQKMSARFVYMTSGRATGLAPTSVWLRRLRALIGEDTPLAVASGMTPENIGSYLGQASCFLVGTSIEDCDRRIAPEKVRAIADQIAAYNKGIGL